MMKKKTNDIMPVISDFGWDYVPCRATKGSAGYDFFAHDDIVIKKGEWTFEDTGIRLLEGAMLPNEFMMLTPRSGMGFKHGLRLANTVGIIDSDFRESIKVKLTADEDITIKKGDRYMQGIICRFGTVPFEQKPYKERDGGIGSTGQ